METHEPKTPNVRESPGNLSDEATPGEVSPGGGAVVGEGGVTQSAAGPQNGEARGRFEALMTEQLDGLYRSALRLTRNRTSAEDLVQDVMLKAWRSFHTFQEGTSIRAWLHRILMNAHYDNYRKQTREPDVVDHEEVSEFYLYDKAQESATLGEAGNPEIEVLDKIMDGEVRESLESLPLQFRSAVILADVQGFSYKEIGHIMGIPVGTVMSRLSRGRHMLQRKLWDYARDHHYVKGDGDGL